MKSFSSAYIISTMSFIGIASLFVACSGNKQSDGEVVTNDSVADSLTVDSTAADTLLSPPKAADGLFDDFIFSFMRSAKFQKKRVAFPLSHIVDGKRNLVEDKKWTYTPLYSKQDVYTVIFDSPQSIQAEKDTSLKHVEVECVYLSKHRIKEYKFDKTDGQWMLTSIVEEALHLHDNSDFYEFYHRFSKDENYQLRHVAGTIRFKTYDSDSFQDIDGWLSREQWPDFRPQLPQNVITNINYGQSYKDNNRRVLMICSQSGGMGCSLTFKRNSKGWMLEKLEN